MEPSSSASGAGGGSAILRVEDLAIAFGPAARRVPAVRGVSFELGRRETLAIVGESGSGKSVTAQAIMGLLPEPPAHVGGRIWFDGADLRATPERELRRLRGADMAMVFQDVASSLNPVRTIGAQMVEPLRLHRGLSRRGAVERAAELIAAVGIPAARRQLDAYPHELSGGMRQRVMIAMALSCEPRLLLVDEATTALDVSVQAQILELLRSVAADSEVAMIVISHDLSVVAGIADRVAVMYAGELVEVAEAQELFAHPRHPYTLGLLTCIPRVDDAGRARLTSIEGTPPDPLAPPVGCLFAPRCPRVFDRCRAERPVLEPRAPEHLAACFAERQRRPPVRDVAPAGPARAARPSAGEPVLLELRDLQVHFEVGRRFSVRQPRRVLRAVDGVSLEVRRGETLGLVGESGSGKSTVARAILRLERPASGAIAFEERDLAGVRGAELRRLRRRIQLVSQDSDSALDPRLTIGTTLAEPLVVHDLVARPRIAARVGELLEMVGLPERAAARYPHELSGGQRQRVNIARALATDPRLVIADEPTSALDVSVRAQVINLLGDLKDRVDLTYVVISHDLSVVRHISDRVAVMYLGRLVEVGDRDALFTDPRHPYTRALLAVVPVPDPAVERRRRLTPIPGEIPSPLDPPSGCPFRTRCALAVDRCAAEMPPLVDVGDGHRAACFFARTEVNHA